MLLFLFACMTNYIKIDQVYHPEERTPVLLSAAALRADSFFPSSAENNFAENLLLFHMQQFVNQKLPIVGQDMVDQILPHLSKMGAVPYIDSERAYRLNFKQNPDSFVNTQLLGIWIDPNASDKFLTGQDLFLFRRTQKVVSLLQENQSDADNFSTKEGYLFIHAAYYSNSFFLMRYPIVILDVLIVGNDGYIWLEARAIGEGEKRMFDLDISEENLRLALQNAIDLLGVLEPIERKRRGKFKKIDSKQ